jgi:hypothetical protein
MDELNIWSEGSSTPLSEAAKSKDPTRGATNWGGGAKNYKFYLEKFGSDNIITIKINGGQHNFFNLNTGKLNPEPIQGDWHAPMVAPNENNTTPNNSYYFTVFPSKK